MEHARTRARRLAREYLDRNDPVGWFEPLYAAAAGDPEAVQWADQVVNPNLLPWLDRQQRAGAGQRALVIGCGLGDDAEELARRGYRVVAFDIAPTAIAWCQRRFPDSAVEYVAADLFATPPAWSAAFDFVLEAYTIQVLPPERRPPAMRAIASYVAPGGTLLVICRGREPDDDPGAMPWPLTRAELGTFQGTGLQTIVWEDFLDSETPPARRFRIEYRRVAE